MSKRLLKRYIPTPEKVRSIRALRFLGSLLHEPNLWHINRHAISRAVLIGVFWCLIPMPFQMIAAALVAVWFNANLPLTLALVWISNPVTMAPMAYGTYVVGTWVLARPASSLQDFRLDWGWFAERLLEVGIPLYVGSLISAVVLSCTSYLLVQYLWRRKVRSDWRLRQQRHRREQATDR
ncbi:MAG: DUF2062 domain-containing protein [Oleiphilaceae bacterium]|nr:DUF2062 domain-containing protein [Oleiphilaceae bacterium]